MRQLAYIEQIKDIKPIAGADKIECATILGFECVVKKDEFKIGDKIIYCEVDSILPELAPFEFLRSRKFRIKTVMLRGQISMGIVFPLSLLKEVDPSLNLNKLSVGDDLTEALKIVKYDPEALLDVDNTTANLAKKSWLERKIQYYKYRLFGIKPIKSGAYPSDVPKTDEVRVQKLAGLLEDKEGYPIYITSKVEGTSATFIYRRGGNWLAKMFNRDGVFQVCSRNIIVFDSQTGSQSTHFLFNVAVKYNIMRQLKVLNRNLALQGEVIGPKIQKNIYNLPKLELRLFSVFDIDKQIYLNCDEMFAIAATLNVPTVPLLSINVKLINDIKYYVELSKGYSKINPKVLREGIVIRAMDSSFSFKSINPEYLLNQEIN